MNETETRAMLREQIAKVFGSVLEAARWYVSRYGEITEATARVLMDVTERALSDWAPEPGPVNPFTPESTAQEWADLIRAVIAKAKEDGYDVGIDVEDYFGPGPYLRISPKDSLTWDSAPIILGEK
jgi:hypothetical protein